MAFDGRAESRDGENFGFATGRGGRKTASLSALRTKTLEEMDDKEAKGGEVTRRSAPLGQASGRKVDDKASGGAAAPAVRRNGLLEPGRRHGQGWQGPREPPRADGLVVVSVHRARSHRQRHPRRPDDRRPHRHERLLRRTEDPRRLDPGRSAPVRRRGPSRRPHRQGRGSGWPSTREGGKPFIPRRSTSRTTASRRSSSSPFEVPDGENVRLTLTATAGNAKDELVSRSADPSLGRAGVRLGVGDQRRQRDRLRRPAAGPGL